MAPLFASIIAIIPTFYSPSVNLVCLLNFLLVTAADPSKTVCAVTGLPAKYIDPLTQSPYATVEAFKIIRERYKQQKRQEEDELEKRSFEADVAETSQQSLGEKQRLGGQIRQSMRRSQEAMTPFDSSSSSVFMFPSGGASLQRPAVALALGSELGPQGHGQAQAGQVEGESDVDGRRYNTRTRTPRSYTLFQ